MHPPSWQLWLYQGVAQDHGPTIATTKVRGWWGEGVLYLLAESSNPRLLEPCRTALHCFVASFHQGSSSLTRRLVQALRATHRHLLERNYHAPPEERAGVSLTAALLQGHDLYIVQGGPAQAYLIQAGTLRRIAFSGAATEGPWLGLATSLELTPRNLHHYALEGGETLLLASASLEHMAGEEALRALLELEPLDALRRLYLVARQEPVFSALLVRVPPSLATTATASSDLGAARPWGLGGLLARGLAWTRPRRPREPAPTARVPPPSPQRSSTPRGAALRRPLAGALFLLVVFLGVALLGTLLLRVSQALEGQSQQRFAALIAEGTATYREALRTADRTQARSLLQTARQRAEEAQRLRSEAPEALPLLRSIGEALKELDAVFVLTGLELLVDLGSLPGGSSVERIALGSRGVYLLERRQGQLFGTPVEGKSQGPALLWHPGQTLAGQMLAPPLEILWMPLGGLRDRSQLLILDAQRRLYAYDDTGGLRSVTLRAPQRWGRLLRARGYNGNLYVLDPDLNQVWRYLPTESGYDSEMRGLLENAVLGEAIDLAVDGSIYVLFASGTIQHFVGGRAQPFPQQGLDRPLRGPMSLFTDAESSSLYVADGGNRRIVVFDKEGNFQRQLVNESMGAPREVAVDEKKGHLYVLADNRLYRALLPKG